MGDETQYFAFISYKREDEEWAKWLSHELEHYHLPHSLNGRDDLPKELRPVFRDIDELSAGNLPMQIHKALKNSKNLIVICSPRSSKSPWVNKEVEEFIGMGKLDRVFPFIIDGIPNAKNEDEECLPRAIINLSEEEERLGASVSEYKESPQRFCIDCPLSNKTNKTKAQGNVNEKGRDAALVKIIAGMLGLNFDILWQRYEREKAEEEQKIKEQRDNLLKVQARFIAEKVHQLTEEGDAYTARLLALAILPNKEIPDYPYTVEAEGALRKACSNENKIFQGHKDVISYLAISPDGNTLASASQDNTIRLWDIKTGKCLNILERPNLNDGYFHYALQDGQLGGMRWVGFKSVEFSSNGTMLIAAGCDATIYVWDLSSMKCVFRESNAEIFYSVNYATFTLDMKNIVAANYCDGREEIISGISIWSFDNHRHCSDIIGALETDFIAIDPNGQYYASSSLGKVTLWDSKRLKSLWVYETNLRDWSLDDKGMVKFSPDGSMIAFSACKQIFIWNTNNKQLIRKIDDNTRIRCIAFMPDGKHIISGGENKSVKMWNISSGDCVLQFKGHTGVINSVCVSNDGHFIISAGYDKEIRLWNISNDNIKPVDSSLSDIYKKEKCGDTQLNFRYDSDSNELYISNVLNNGLGFCIENPYSAEINEAILSPDNNCLLMLSFSNEVYICKNFASLVDECIRQYNPSDNVYITPTFNIPNLELVLLKGHTDTVVQACFSPDNKYVLTYALDYTIQIWDVKSGKRMQILDDGSNTIYDMVEFSDDGDYIIATKEGNRKAFYYPSLEKLIEIANESLKDRFLTQIERERYYLE